MSHSLTVGRAIVIALWLQTLLYGVFLVFCATALYVLLHKRLHGKVNFPMVIVSLTMFALITTHMVCGIVRVITTFTTSADPVTYSENIAQTPMWIKTVVYYVIILVGDAIAVYRCWVVWAGDWRIMALPSLLYLADICVGAIAVHALTEIPPGQAIFSDKLYNWALAFFSLTLVLSNLCSLLIASRIWYMSRNLAHSQTGKSTFRRVAMILIQSAAIYSFSLFATIVTYAIKSNALYITSDTLPPIVGIVFEINIVRVGLGISSGSVATHWDAGHISHTGIGPSMVLQSIHVHTPQGDFGLDGVAGSNKHHEVVNGTKPS